MIAKQRDPGADGSGTWDDTLSDHRTRQSHHIVAAAMAILGRDGIAGLTMSALAQEAGVSRQTLYKYFPDVDAVLLGLAASGGQMESELVEQVDAADDAAAGMRIFIEAVMRAASSGHPSSTALVTILPPDAREELRAHVGRSERLVVDLVRRGSADGSFRADLDPELDGRITFGTLMAAHDMVATADVDLDRASEHVSIAVSRMLEPHDA